ncbi:MAG: anhydro-N-acetylmuramic acid kinase [Rickettsiales bacterium]|nr:anhydro-N-acetylmuramic acid kinase [Rickettsiales bacterium]
MMRPMTTDKAQPIWAIGLMSGTSFDGVDAALIRTDGQQIFERGEWLTIAYSDQFQHELAYAIQQSTDIMQVTQKLTYLHAEAVQALLKKAGMQASEVGVIGFHGQTIDHQPDDGMTWQIGDGALLAAMTGIDVVCDFRSRDVAEGGQGAPLVPLYHAALCKDLPKPVAILNIGGVANVTWVDDDRSSPWLLGFDTGPGNALINDMMKRTMGEMFDRNGQMAESGNVDKTALDGYLYDTWFATPPPKSLDRDDFGIAPVLHLVPENAVATLSELTVQGIVKARQFMPIDPQQWIVCGGGRHNSYLMRRLKELLGNVVNADTLGWEGDALEAQAFGYLAVRSLRNLPLTLPSLTGVRRPVSGGAFYRA